MGRGNWLPSRDHQMGNIGQVAQFFGVGLPTERTRSDWALPCRRDRHPGQVPRRDL